MITTSADSKLVQKLNRLTVLDIIRCKGPISRAEISKLTNLSPTTVSYAVTNLIEDGFVIETGVGDSSGGRKPILIEFNPKGRHVISIEINRSAINGALYDLNGIMEYKIHEDLKNLESTNVISSIEEVIEEIIVNAKTSEILGVGISIPGIIDKSKDSVLYSTYLNWHNINLKEIIEDKYGYPVFIENDTNLAALAEKVLGFNNLVDNLIYISIGKGIGTGIIINRKVYSGFNGSAGEFGHISINKNGDRCVCGNYGCLYTYASETFIETYMLKHIKMGFKTIIKEDNLDIKNIIDAANGGDKVSIEAINEATNNLAIGIANILNLFNPEMIVIGANNLLKCNFYFNLLKEKVYDYALETSTNNLKFESSRVENPELAGAAILVIEESFKLPIEMG